MKGIVDPPTGAAGVAKGSCALLKLPNPPVAAVGCGVGAKGSKAAAAEDDGA